MEREPLATAERADEIARPQFRALPLSHRASVQTSARRLSHDAASPVFWTGCYSAARLRRRPSSVTGVRLRSGTSEGWLRDGCRVRNVLLVLLLRAQPA